MNNVNRRFSLYLREQKYFSVEEIVFLRCGIEPLSRNKRTPTHSEQLIVSSRLDTVMFPPRYLSASERANIKKSEQVVWDATLWWPAGVYCYDNPEVWNQQQHLPHDQVALEVHNHGLYLREVKSELWTKEALKLIRLQIDGFGFELDLDAILETLKHRYLVPFQLRADIAKLKEARTDANRKLEGIEVRDVLRQAHTESREKRFKDCRWVHRFEGDDIHAFFSGTGVLTNFHFSTSCSEPLKAYSTEVEKAEILVNAEARTQLNQQPIKQKIIEVKNDFAEPMLEINEANKKELENYKAARKKGADARHAEHREIKTAIFALLDTQADFPTIEAAAREITKHQPIKHETARKYYKEWLELRSASRP